MKNDPFFTAENCDRCNGSLKIRTMSWFTEETICVDCSAKERVIKNELRVKGYSNALEGCGYIPNPMTMPNKNQVAL